MPVEGVGTPWGTPRNDPFLTHPKTLPNCGADTMGGTMGGTMGACNGRGFTVGVLDPGGQCREGHQLGLAGLSAVGHGVWQKDMSII